jgi:hypothetical protein
MPSVVGQAVGFSLVLVRFGFLARRSAELTRQLRREQDERATRKVVEERGRIARELHDVDRHRKGLRPDHHGAPAAGESPDAFHAYTPEPHTRTTDPTTRATTNPRNHHPTKINPTPAHQP